MSMTTPFKNNLVMPNQVFDIVTRRRGIVATTPREGNRRTAVIFDGTSTPKYVDVMELRFIPPNAGGAPEDVPPIDGDPPPLPETHRARKVSEPKEPRKWSGSSTSTPVQQLAERRVEIKTEIENMTKRATDLRSEDERLEKAIAVLSA